MGFMDGTPMNAQTEPETISFRKRQIINSGTDLKASDLNRKVGKSEKTGAGWP
jgi:hypothetical protein